MRVSLPGKPGISYVATPVIPQHGLCLLSRSQLHRKTPLIQVSRCGALCIVVDDSGGELLSAETRKFTQSTKAPFFVSSIFGSMNWRRQTAKHLWAYTTLESRFTNACIKFVDQKHGSSHALRCHRQSLARTSKVQHVGFAIQGVLNGIALTSP